ncbi:MAG: hypothetical protein ACOCXF_00035 [bacterium]
MINRDQIESLMSYRNYEHPVVSMYVTSELPKKFRAKLNSMVRGKIKELNDSSRFSAQEKKGLENLLTKMETVLKERTNRYEGTKMIALFADTAGFWEEFELPVGYPNRVVIDPDPYTRPLTAVRDQFARFCVLVSNSHKAVVYALSAKQLAEEKEIFTEEEMAPDTDEALQGFGEQRHQRNERDHLYKHIKKIAETAFQVFRNGRFDYLLIGAPKDKELPLLKDSLHSYLQRHLVGDFNARPDEPKQDILKKASAAAAEWERQQEENLLQSIDSELYEGGKATADVGPTLKALMNGQIHTLAVQEGYSRPGYKCPNDYYFDLSKKKCPICGEELQPVEDIIDEIVEETLRQNGEVHYLQYHPEKLDEKGVAAQLRFTL